MTIRRKVVWGGGRWLVRALGLALLIGVLFGAHAVLAAQPPQTTAAQDQYVPIDRLPPGDTLPAAPLLIAAYAVAWLVVFGYLWSIWRRLTRLERDIAEVGRRIEAGARR